MRRTQSQCDKATKSATTAPSRDRLLAILAADAVGYSRLMAQDERCTIASLEAARSVFRKHTIAHDGRVVDMAGDSVLAVFGTATAAVNTALAAQKELTVSDGEMAEQLRLRFRIGIHVGDVIEKADGSVYGDGVNIASRLEGLAAPDGIVISQAVQGMVARRVEAAFDDIGEQRVKNIAQAVRAYRLRPAAAAMPPGATVVRRRYSHLAAVVGALVFLGMTALLVLWLKPWAPVNPVSGSVAAANAAPRTIAVLAFASPGTDKTDEIFADGVSDELLDVLSRLPELRVAARTSSFQFKDKPAMVQEIGRQLGVDYVVEGNVRKAAGRVRIGAKLLKVADGFPIWSETFEREAKDALTVQGDVAAQIAKALAVKIGAAQLAGSGTANAEALQLYLEGKQTLENDESPAGAARAEALFEKALELDPRFARALAGLANAWLVRGMRERDLNFANRDSPWQLRVIAKAREAIALDPGLADAFAVIGVVQMYAWRIEESQRSLRQALALNSGHSRALGWYSFQLVAREGRMDDFLREHQRAVERDPLSASESGSHALALMAAARFEEAVVYADRALQLGSPMEAGIALGVKSWALAGAGRKAEALALVDKLLRDKMMNRWARKALWLLGNRRQLTAELDKMPPASRYSRSETLVMLGRNDEALEMLPKDESETRFDLLPRYMIDAEWDGVRQDPRFRAMLARFNVAGGLDKVQAWRVANVPRLPTRP